eukprot:6175081-Pleurochrysis_carterae.AAC.7
MEDVQVRSKNPYDIMRVCNCIRKNRAHANSLKLVCGKTDYDLAPWSPVPAPNTNVSEAWVPPKWMETGLFDENHIGSSSTKDVEASLLYDQIFLLRALLGVLKATMFQVLHCRFNCCEGSGGCRIGVCN